MNPTRKAYGATVSLVVSPGAACLVPLEPQAVAAVTVTAATAANNRVRRKVLMVSPGVVERDGGMMSDHELRSGRHPDGRGGRGAGGRTPGRPDREVGAARRPRRGRCGPVPAPAHDR